MAASYVHNHTLTRTNTFSQTHICSPAFCTLAHSLKHMLSFTHTHAQHTQMWEVGVAARPWGHMMVGGRFERAYLRIDGATGCSCAEMIYMGRNAHTFWSLHPQTCARLCETQAHVIVGERQAAQMLQCETICMFLCDGTRMTCAIIHFIWYFSTVFISRGLLPWLHRCFAIFSLFEHAEISEITI